MIINHDHDFVFLQWNEHEPLHISLGCSLTTSKPLGGDPDVLTWF